MTTREPAQTTHLLSAASWLTNCLKWRRAASCTNGCCGGKRGGPGDPVAISGGQLWPGEASQPAGVARWGYREGWRDDLGGKNGESGRVSVHRLYKASSSICKLRILSKHVRFVNRRWNRKFEIYRCFRCTLYTASSLRRLADKISCAVMYSWIPKSLFTISYWCHVTVIC